MCEGRTFLDVLNEIRENNQKHFEGLVLRLVGIGVVKVKTSWWHDAQRYKYRRWQGTEQREQLPRRNNGGGKAENDGSAGIEGCGG